MMRRIVYHHAKAEWTEHELCLRRTKPEVSRTINGTTTYSVWDGWNLVRSIDVLERVAAWTQRMFYGATGLVRDME